jgi:propanediol dehydratase small subunit
VSSEYPLGTSVATPNGTPLAEVTLDAVRAGRIDADEMRATPETLRRQAAIARGAGRSQLAENLERAAELAGVPADMMLEIYTALRPRRSSGAELDAWAERLEHELAAPLTAAFVREARAVYAERGLLSLADATV